MIVQVTLDISYDGCEAEEEEFEAIKGMFNEDWGLGETKNLVSIERLRSGKAGDKVNNAMASGIGELSMRIRVFTVGFNEKMQQAIILGPDGQFMLSQNSAHRLRNHLCNWLGTPGPEELAKPNGDLSLMALDLGQVMMNEADPEMGS